MNDSEFIKGMKSKVLTFGRLFILSIVSNFIYLKDILNKLLTFRLLTSSLVNIFAYLLLMYYCEKK